MTEVIVGGLAFLLFIIYDLEQAGVFRKRFHKFVRLFFLLGFVFLAFSTIRIAGLQAVACTSWTLHAVVFLGCALCFLLLLIYTLFFALPFQETYVVQNVGYKVCAQGMYALCRHPGVLWFTGFYLSLWFALGGFRLFCIALWYSCLNLCYVIFQDCYTFPKIFLDYGHYKQQVPFLIPNRKSVQQCLSTLRKAGDVREI